MITTEILQLIAACKEAGVAEFEHEGLKFQFGKPIAAEDAKIEAENLSQNEIRLKREELENLKLTDPLAYETFIQYYDRMEN